MVKRDKNVKNKSKKNQTSAPVDVKEEKVESPDKEYEELHELEDEDEQVTKKEYKKSRIKNIEKNMEILETNDTKTGVIYIGHLPWGFEEVGLKKYFEQFGKITRILVPRSVKVLLITIDWKNERICIYRIRRKGRC
jgi:RNA recognition motif-containing protein